MIASAFVPHLRKSLLISFSSGELYIFFAVSHIWRVLNKVETYQDIVPNRIIDFTNIVKGERRIK